MSDAFESRRRASVILIEDETAIRQMMMAAINTMSEFSVIGEYATVVEGLQAAEIAKPTVVVLDWVLRQGTGKDFLRAIRGWKRPPFVLIFSGQTSALTVNEALAHGATGFIDKSSRLADFMGALRNVAEGRVYLGSEPTRVLKGIIASSEPERIGATLSTRESHVLRLVAEGRPSKEIAERLGISLRTVDSHRAALIRKTGMHSVAELTRHAFAIGLVNAPHAGHG